MEQDKLLKSLSLLYSDLLELDKELSSELNKGPNYWRDKDPAKYKKMLAKLARKRKTPGDPERATQQILQAKRREKGGAGTTAGQGRKGHSHGHMKGKTGAEAAKYAKKEKAAGEKMSIDRKDNSAGYESSNTRLAPQSLNRGDENNKRKKEWYKKHKK